MSKPPSLVPYIVIDAAAGELALDLCRRIRGHLTTTTTTAGSGLRVAGENSSRRTRAGALLHLEVAVDWSGAPRLTVVADRSGQPGSIELVFPRHASHRTTSSARQRDQLASAVAEAIRDHLERRPPRARAMAAGSTRPAALPVRAAAAAVAAPTARTEASPTRLVAIDRNALIRGGPPGFAPTGGAIAEYTWVKELETQGAFVRVARMDDSPIGWTRATNLATLFQDRQVLDAVPLVPETPAPVNPAWPIRRQQIAACFNRVGGLVESLAQELGIETAVPLGVWWVESGGRAHTAGHAVIRFENHVFWDRWGKSNASVFDAHFQFGTRPPQTAAACVQRHKCHQFRAGTAASSPWETFHGNQTKEYTVLGFARTLDSAAALESISIGGPQIMGYHHHPIGYDNAEDMFDAFQASERPHVLGFFDFLLTQRLMDAVRAKDWTTIGDDYNGDGAVYGPKLKAAYEDAAAALAAR